MDQRHEMILEKTFSSGDEEWQCPTCGRRMLINWRPEFKKTILNAGDDYALHSASKGLIPTGPSDGMPPNADVPPIETSPDKEAARLAPWQAWFDAVNFNRLWDKKS